MKTLKIFVSLVLILLVSVVVAAILPTDPAIGLSVISAAVVPIIGSIKTSAEMKIERHAVYEKAKAIMDKAREEKRALTPEEQIEYDKLDKQLDDMEADIKRVEKDERRALEMAGGVMQQRQAKREEKEVSGYSLFRAIRMKMQHVPLDGLEAEMDQEAREEARSIGQSLTGIGVPSIVLRSWGNAIHKRNMSATGQTSAAGDQGGMLVATEKEGLIMALRPMLRLAQMGVRTIGGMVGNLDIVKGTSVATAWEGENDENAESNVSTSKISVSPKRLGAKSYISKQLLFQTSQGLQQTVIEDIFAAIAQAVELAALHGGGNITGLASTSGIGSVVGGDNGAAPTYAHLTELESKVELGNALMDSLYYLTNPKVKNKLKNTKIDSGSGLMVWPTNDNVLNGYPAFASNLVKDTLTKGTSSGVCSAIFFGNWSNMALYNWGGIDLVVDDYTRADYNEVKLVVNSFWDMAVKQPAAFAAMLDALHA